MRPLSLVGIVLLAIGAFLVFRGARYSSKEEVLRVGDVKATVEEKKAVPPGLGESRSSRVWFSWPQE